MLEGGPYAAEVALAASTDFFVQKTSGNYIGTRKKRGIEERMLLSSDDAELIA